MLPSNFIRRSIIIRPSLILNLCVLLIICSFTYTTDTNGKSFLIGASAAPTNITDVIFGICRVPYLDQADRLSGLMTAIYAANKGGIFPSGYRVRAEVYYYPHCNATTQTCDFADSLRADGLRPFIGNMSRFAAVLFPHFNISDLIIDAAAILGIPVIDPGTIRTSDYEERHVLLAEHHIETELSVVIRYMLMAHSCARTGIVHERQPAYAQQVSEAFEFGGYDSPAVLSWPATQEQAREMFFGDPHRKCIVFLTSSISYIGFMALVYQDPRFIAGDVKMFSWSQTSTSIIKVGNTSAPFTNWYFPKVIIPISSGTQLATDFTGEAAAWALTDRDSDVATYYLAGEVGKGTPTPSGIMWFSRAMYAFKLTAYALLDVHTVNTSYPNSPLWAKMLSVAYETKFWVSDFPFFLPINRCPQKPLPQVCSCNVITRVSYLLSVEGVNGTPIPVFDRPLLGELNVASVPFSAEQCIYKLSRSSYPFRMMVVMDFGVSAASELVKTVGKTDLETMLYSIVAAQNFADPAPVRPWRLITESFPTGILPSLDPDDIVTATAAVQAHVEVYKPFFLLGTGTPIGNVDVASAFTNGEDQLDDYLLVSRADGWSPLRLQLEPSNADYMHALSFYYAANAATFSGVYVLAATETEKWQAINSLHTFQVNFDVDKNTAVSTDPSEWERIIRGWAAPSATSLKPFILTSSLNQPALTQKQFTILSTVQNVVIGMCGSEDAIHTNWLATNLSASTLFPTAASVPTTDLGDIIYASPFSEYWVEGNALRVAMLEMGMPQANLDSRDARSIAYALGFGLALQLGQQATVNFKSAGEVLYTARSASVGDIPLGPFSNDTCSAEVLASKTVDRLCQCSKAVRQFRVHSFYNRAMGEPSTRTGQLVYSMGTCGVEYLPLILPDGDNLKTILIAAIVGGVGLLTLCTSLLVVVCCCGGRNNSAAPKDPSRPFTIVFTDIQASTTLWSRAPAIMSDAVEQHGTIIRKLISTYGGYEVKTIGDSFMVAFKSPENAVTFSLKLQLNFYSSTWPSEIDQHYKEIIEAQALERMEEEEKSETASGKNSNGEEVAQNHKELICLNAPSDDAEYDRLWHGIRVRVGINYGMGEIRKDPVTMGYDYFGTIVNTAARVEGVGHGGQTLVTEAVMKELPSTYLAANTASVVDMGPQPMRGLDDRIPLLQLLPATFVGRQFPNLRLDVENVLEDGSESSATNATAGSQNGQLTLEQMAAKACSQFIRRAKPSFQGVGADGGPASTASATYPADNPQFLSAVMQTGTAKRSSITGSLASNKVADPSGNDPLRPDDATAEPSSPVNNPTGAETTSANGNGILMPSVLGTVQGKATAELISYYRFLVALMSTSAEGWRKDTLKHLAKRWHIAHATKVGSSEGDQERMRTLVSIAVKAMIVVRAQQAKERAQAASRSNDLASSKVRGSSRGGVQSTIGGGRMGYSSLAGQLAVDNLSILATMDANGGPAVNSTSANVVYYLKNESIFGASPFLRGPSNVSFTSNANHPNNANSEALVGMVQSVNSPMVKYATFLENNEAAIGRNGGLTVTNNANSGNNNNNSRSGSASRSRRAASFSNISGEEGEDSTPDSNKGSPLNENNHSSTNPQKNTYDQQPITVAEFSHSMISAGAMAGGAGKQLPPTGSFASTSFASAAKGRLLQQQLTALRGRNHNIAVANEGGQYSASGSPVNGSSASPLEFSKMEPGKGVLNGDASAPTVAPQ